VRALRSDTTFTTQESDRASFGRATSGYVTLPLSLRLSRQGDVNKLPSVAPSGEQSLATNERRHIHFHDKVEQFIAVDVDGGNDEDGGESYTIYGDGDGDDSSSDDGVLMMKESSGPKPLNQRNRKQFSEQHYCWK